MAMTSVGRNGRPMWCGMTGSTIAREPALRERATPMKAEALSILDRMDPRERDSLIASLPQIRSRVDEVARSWARVAIGDSMRLTWTQ